MSAIEDDGSLQPFDHVAEHAEGWSAGWYLIDIRLNADPRNAEKSGLYPDYGDGYWEQLRMPLDHLHKAGSRRIRGVVLLRRTVRGIALRLGSEVGASAPASFRLRQMSRGRALAFMLCKIVWRTGRRLWFTGFSDLLSAGGLSRGVGRLYAAYSGEAPPLDSRSYRAWIASGEADRVGPRRHVASSAGPLLSIVMPLYNTPPHLLRACLDSVLSQSYANWELCIADDASDAQATVAVLADCAARDRRIKVVRLAINAHISSASNAALDLAQGEFVVLLDHDDLLHLEALQELAMAIWDHPDWDMIYTDEDRVGPDGKRCDPYFKPDFAPELLEGQNFIGHLAAYRTALLRALGGFREGYEGSQDWDLALRVYDATGAHRIGHIPRVLYHWRMSPTSTAGDVMAKPYASLAAEKAIADHLERRGELASVVEPISWIPGGFRIRHAVDQVPAVAIFIDVREGIDVVERTLVGLRMALSADMAVSVRMFLISRDGGDAMVRAMHRHDTGWSVGEEVSRRPSFSEACDIAVALCGSHILLFVNAGTVPLRRRSIHELLAQVGRPDVAAAGGKVFNAGGTLRQSIRLVGTHEPWDAGAGQPAASPGPMNLLWLVQNVSVLACDALAVRRDRYQEVGGWPIGLDKGAAVEILCQRLGSAGYRLVWTPFSEFGTAPPADDPGAPVAAPTSAEYESYDMYRAYRRCQTLAGRMPSDDSCD